MGREVSEAEIKRQKKKRGLVSVKTVHPNPNNKSEYARVYVFRTAGPRGGKTLMGPIQRKGK